MRDNLIYIVFGIILLVLAFSNVFLPHLVVFSSLQNTPYMFDLTTSEVFGFYNYLFLMIGFGLISFSLYTCPCFRSFLRREFT